MTKPARTTVETLDDGTVEYRDAYGRMHRDDGPAYFRPDGLKAWYVHGELHRDRGPAIIEPDGTEVWFRHGRRIKAVGL